MGLRLLPDNFDNQQRGHPFALWLFYLATIVTVGRSLAHIFLADGGAQSIATIPLDQFTPGVAASVVSMFAFWGLSQLLLAVIMVLVALRYRSMIPLMYLLILLEYGGRIAIGMIKPLALSGTPPGAIGNLVFILIAMVGLVLSMQTVNSPRDK